MTYSDNIRAGIDGLHDAKCAASAALQEAFVASVCSTEQGKVSSLDLAIENAKRVRDLNDAVLENLESARTHLNPRRLRVVATGNPPVRDYPDGVA